MPTLSITKTYQDGDILTEADLDNIRQSIENFFNTTGIDSDNIQAGGVAASDIGINDSEWLEFGTGNDGRIGVDASDDFRIQNVTTDKDIIFSGSPGGVLTEIVRIDASSSSMTVAATDTAVDGSVVRMATLKQYVPAGLIMPYGGTSAPTGYLLCDGSAVSRTTYATLFALIGITAGQGDGSTTFNLPDLRGRFLRGWDNGAGRDPDAASRTTMATGGNSGDAVFSVQADEFAAHVHVQTNASDGGTAGNVSTAGSSGNINAGGRDTSSTGGNETRPINANVNFIIKY